MNRGVNASEALRALLNERDWTHEELAARTGITSGTISSYATKNDDARRRLGIQNGRKIAAAFGVPLSRLGLAEEGAHPNDPVELRRGLAALEASVRKLTRRVEALEKSRGEEPRSDQQSP